jgi:hypothetical protein
MKRSRFSDEQIIAILKELEVGIATIEVCRRGISSETFYKWKSVGTLLVRFRTSSYRSPVRF